MERKTENTVLQWQKKLELKKHVAIIHSSNKLTLLQRKIANALLFNAYNTLQSQDEHTIHIARLCELIGYASHDHKTIKKALVNLLSTVLEWNLVDGERLDAEGIWNASSIIADASIYGPLCTYSYSNKMRQLLYKPDMYGRLDMITQSKFQSAYGLALYENCNRFQEIGHTPWLGIEKFRKLMGVEDGKYKVFRDFKTRVLDKAIEEVNKYSSLMISPQLRKQSRKVNSIQFLIQKNPAMETENKKNNEISKILKTEFGLSVRQINNVFNNHEENYVWEKIELIQASASFKNGRVKNLARYLLSALRDDYQTNKASRVAKPHVPAPSIPNDQDDVILKTEFRRFQEKQLFQLFEQLPDDQKTKILKKFEKFLTGMYHYVYMHSGLQNLLVQEQLCLFLHQIKHESIHQLITYETWRRKKKKC